MSLGYGISRNVMPIRQAANDWIEERGNIRLNKSTIDLI